MKKNFMTRVLAVALSAAMALSMATATNLTVAEAASKPAMKTSSFKVRIGNKAKNYYASAATQKAYKIVKAKAGNTDKATAKVVKSGKAVAITAGSKTGKTTIKLTFKNKKTAAKTTIKFAGKVLAAKVAEQAIKEIKQTALDTIEVTLAVSPAEIKASDFSVQRETVNTSNKKLVIKSATAKADDTAKVSITVYGSMTGSETFTVSYTAGDKVLTKQFVATDGKVDSIDVTPLEVTAGKDTTLYYMTYDKDGILLAKEEINSGKDSKVQITGKATKGVGYITGSKLYISAVGDTYEITATYHTYKYEGAEEVGAKVTTKTITGVENATKISNAAYTLSKTSIWNWAKTTPVTSIALNDKDYCLRINPTTESGEVITTKMGWTVESSDQKVFVVNGNVTSESLLVTPTGEGSAYALIKDAKGNVVYSLPISVKPARHLASIVLSKTGLIVSTNAAVTYASDYTRPTCFDQYGDVYGNVDYSLALVSVPDDENHSKSTIANAMISTANGNYAVNTGNLGATYKPGNYGYVVTASDKATSNTCQLPFTVDMRAPLDVTDDAVAIVLTNNGYRTNTANTSILQFGQYWTYTATKLGVEVVTMNNAIVKTESIDNTTVGAITIKKNGHVIATTGVAVTTPKTCAAVLATEFANLKSDGKKNTATNPLATIYLVRGDGTNNNEYIQTLEAGQYTVEADVYTKDSEGKVKIVPAATTFTVENNDPAVTATVLKTNIATHSIKYSNEKVFTWYYDGVAMVTDAGKVNTNFVKDVDSTGTNYSTALTTAFGSTDVQNVVYAMNKADEMFVGTKNTGVVKTAMMKLALPTCTANGVTAGKLVYVPVKVNAAFEDYTSNSASWTID